jgi:xanthine dehydrogenase accessory factor
MSAPNPMLLLKALDWLGEGREVALATVIQTWGSAPQPVGSQLLIDGSGNFLGSASGGCVEAEIIDEAADVIESGKPKSLEYGVEDSVAWKAGLACGGSVRVFVEKIQRGPQADLLHRLVRDMESRRPVALVLDLATGKWELAHSQDALGKDLAAPLEDAFRHDRSAALTGSNGEIFVNVFNPVIRLVIVGAVHIAQHLVAAAQALDYAVKIVDPREAFATAERFDVEISRDYPDEALPEFGLDGRTAVIALTHDPKIDDPALVCALASDAFYVGALGSRKTHARRVERLLKAGVDPAAIERIHAPIGLDIGAQGAAEIALSIIAEIVAVHRGKAGE